MDSHFYTHLCYKNILFPIHSRFESWVVTSPKLKKLIIKNEFIEEIPCNFLVQTILYFFLIKVEKKTPSKVTKIYSSRYFYCPELHKQPKQKKSCSKMLLIDQLFIKLDMDPLFFRAIHVALQRFAIFCSKMHCFNEDMLVSSKASRNLSVLLGNVQKLHTKIEIASLREVESLVYEYKLWIQILIRNFPI